MREGLVEQPHVVEVRCCESLTTFILKSLSDCFDQLPTIGGTCSSLLLGFHKFSPDQPICSNDFRIDGTEDIGSGFFNDRFDSGIERIRVAPSANHCSFCCTFLWHVSQIYYAVSQSQRADNAWLLQFLFLVNETHAAFIAQRDD